MSDFSAHLVVCDDIRHEVGNKYSLIGVYGNDIIVEKFPSILAKLCFQVTIRARKDNPAKSLALRIEAPDNAPVGIEIPTEALQEAVKQLTDPDRIYISYLVTLFSGPIELKSSGVVRVTAKVNEEEIHVGVVRLLSVTESGTATPSAEPRNTPGS